MQDELMRGAEPVVRIGRLRRGLTALVETTLTPRDGGTHAARLLARH